MPLPRAMVATFSSSCGVAPPAPDTGVWPSDSSDDTRYCGVCTLTVYCTPFCGLSHTLGCVCPLDASDTSRSLATSRVVSANEPARVRSTLTVSCGASRRCCRYTSTAPGILRSRASSARATTMFSARLVPVTCTFTGAGRPALRICPMMSADWKNTNTLGNSSRSTRRISLAYCAVSPFRSSVSTISRSASVTPVVGLSLNARLVRLVLAMPTLSRMVATSSGGMTARMRASTAATMRAVSSSRVPTGARRCRRICPASTCGKKSRPSHGTSAPAETMTSTMPASSRAGLASIDARARR